MKRITIILTIALLFLISGYSHASSVSISLRMVNTNLNVGDKFPVEVVIDQVTDLKGVNVLISYDNLKLEYLSILKGVIIDNFAEDIIPDTEDAKTTGKLEYSAVLEGPGTGIESTKDEILLTINFLVRSPGDTWVKLLPNDISLADSTANAIPTSIDSIQRAIKIGWIFELKKVFNYPNPVDNSGKTVIRCESLAILDGLEARIFDISGELVKTIEFQDFKIGQAPIYEYEWDCTNENGQDVANGTYILWIKAKLGSDEKNQTWKIAVLR
jgi:hypothetical protein